MQDLVGVRVADAGEEMRVGQCTLERVIVLLEPFAKSIRVDFENLYAARIHRLDCGSAVYQMKRSAPLRAGLGERERAIVEHEESERYTCG